jgi:hypothetical protein
MNKAMLVEAICKQLEVDLEAMKVAAKATHDAATNEESTPENEYDTRALEAHKQSEPPRLNDNSSPLAKLK